MPSDLLGGWHEVCQLANNDLAACQSVLPMSRGPSCEVVFRKGRLWRRCAASGKPSDPILPDSRTSRRVGLDPTDGGSAESLVGSEDPGAVQHMVPAGESTPGLACATITRLRTPRASAKNFCAGKVNFRRVHPGHLGDVVVDNPHRSRRQGPQPGTPHVCHPVPTGNQRVESRPQDGV